MNNHNSEPIKGHKLNPIPTSLVDWIHPINSVFNPEATIAKSTLTYLKALPELSNSEISISNLEHKSNE